MMKYLKAAFLSSKKPLMIGKIKRKIVDDRKNYEKKNTYDRKNLEKARKWLKIRENKVVFPEKKEGWDINKL